MTKKTVKKTTQKKTKLTPTAGYVMIKPEEAVEKTQSGIYLPDNAKEEKPQKGEVLAIGDSEYTDGGFERKSPAKVGQTVIYKKWGGNEVKIDGQEYLFVKFEDILAVEN